MWEVEFDFHRIYMFAQEQGTTVRLMLSFLKSEQLVRTKFNETRTRFAGPFGAMNLP